MYHNVSENRYLQDIAKMRFCINVIHDLVFTIFFIEKWRQEYNTERPHSSLGYRPPAPEAIGFQNFEYFFEYPPVVLDGFKIPETVAEHHDNLKTIRRKREFSGIPLFEPDV
jgi:hypothetical protein